MKTFTSIGHFAFVFHHKEWDKRLKTIIHQKSNSFFTLSQFPFIYVLRPNFKEMGASKEAFGELNYHELTYHSNERVTEYCKVCPNKIKRELLAKHEFCKPCKPRDSSFIENDWDRTIMKDIKNTLIESGFIYQDKENFYHTIFKVKTNRSELRYTLFDLKKLEPSVFHIETEGNRVNIHVPFWDFGMQRFRSEIFVLKAKKISEDGLCYIHYNDIELEHEFYKVSNESFKRRAELHLMYLLQQAPYFHQLDENTTLPVSFIRYFSIWTKEISYTHIDNAVELVHILDCGKESYYTDRGRVYEHSRWTTERKFQPYAHHDRHKSDEYFLYHENEFYRYICDSEDFVFRLNVMGEVECGKRYDRAKYQYKTYNELVLNVGKIIKNNYCSVFAPEFIGDELSFAVGDYARIVNPSEKHELLRDRLGEILSVENDVVILGFENNFFQETFNKEECIPVKS